jgi:hypothetical protein
MGIRLALSPYLLRLMNPEAAVISGDESACCTKGQ